MEKQEHAAVTIQSNYRGWRVRKEFQELRLHRQTPMPTKNARNTADGNGFMLLKYVKHNTSTTDAHYTIAVFVGNRWCADFEGNLYLIMHGHNEGDNETRKVVKSNKLWLKQVDNVQNEELRFGQNQVFVCA